MTLVDEYNAASTGHLPGLLGLEIVAIEPGVVRARLSLRPDHLAPNGYLHAATVIGLADTACGYGSRVSLPDGAVGFTTAELKANFTGTARDGEIRCEARLVHGGRSTQVWDATVTSDADRPIALFRCTQMVLWPKP